MIITSFIRIYTNLSFIHLIITSHNYILRQTTADRPLTLPSYHSLISSFQNLDFNGSYIMSLYMSPGYHICFPRYCVQTVLYLYYFIPKPYILLTIYILTLLLNILLYHLYIHFLPQKDRLSLTIPFISSFFFIFLSSILSLQPTSFTL